MERPITVVIADDHPFLRAGVRVLLEKTGQICVVGEAGDGLEALRKVGELAPDVLVLDMQMPYLDGLEVLDALRENSIDVRVIVLSAYDDLYFAREAIARGARGYFLKEDAPGLLVNAIHTSMEGSALGISPRIEL